ncbi:response regulator transcription factor [Limnobacter sp.]|uniref:helix-turn-helix transcriptional regulator n=1 Tax=Limnobacter sp. TaxID=2003368 RepID=UPI0035178386
MDKFEPGHVALIGNNTLLGAVVVMVIQMANPRASIVRFRDQDAFERSMRRFKVAFLHQDELVGSAQEPMLPTLQDMHRRGAVCLIGRVPPGVPLFFRYVLDPLTPAEEVFEEVRELMRECGLISHRSFPREDLPMPFQFVRYGLRPRHVQILKLAAEGASNQEIAQTLGISVSTIRGHVQEMFVRMNVRNIAHAVAIFSRACLIDELRMGLDEETPVERRI